jgi:hypothetical protein
MSASVPRIVDHRWIPPSIAAGLIAMAGCLARPDAPQADQSVDADNSPFKVPVQANRTSNFDRPAQRLVVEFSVFRWTAPKGVFTDADSIIWKRVAGVLSSSNTTMHLADSGFRAAIGRESDRSELVDALKELAESVDLRSVIDQVVPDVSRAAEIGIGQLPSRTLTVFYQNGEGRAVGYDFKDARPKLLLSFGMRADNLREVVLRIVPAIDEPPGPPKWVGVAGGGFQQIQEERRKVFTDMEFSATIPEDGFLLIGGMPIIYERPYLGRAFFVEQPAAGMDDESTRESIFIICPVIHTVADRLGVESAPLGSPVGNERGATDGK